MSDHTRRTIDEEQQYLTDLAHRRALRVVGENRTLLEAFAFTLLENEVLEREDIDRIMARLPREPERRRRADRARGRSRLGAHHGCAAVRPRPASCLRVRSRRRRAPRAPRVHSAPCSSGWTTSESRCPIWTPRSSCTATGWGCPSSTARPSSSSASTLCCWAWAKGTWSCSSPPIPKARSAAFSSATAPGSTTWPTRQTTSKPPWNRRGRPGYSSSTRNRAPGSGNSRVAFLHPRSTGGVLTELVQPAEGH